MTDMTKQTEAPREAQQPAPATELREQEPVAWRTFDGEGGYEYRSYEMNEQYAQEWEQRNPKHKGWVEPLYTSPPAQRKPWVGLTDVEIASACKKHGGAEWWWRDIEEYGRAIEAKLREKNNG